jgi:hypothetical protein
MKTYNRIMEIFWFVAGMLLLAYSGYAFFTGGSWDDVKLTAFPAFMALILAIFRYIARNNSNKDYSKKG